MTKSLRSRMFSFFCLALALCCPPGAAQNIGRPNAEEGPTIVHVSLVVLNVDEINNAKQSFTANVFYLARWQDDRLAHEDSGVKVLSLDEAWSPQLQFTNQQRVIRTFPEQLLVKPSGEVTYRQRVWGAFSQSLHLTDFPLDQHRFEVLLVAADTATGMVEIEMVLDAEYPSGLAPGFSLPDWKILRWEASPTTYSPLDDTGGIPGLVFSFEARRYFGYYLLNLVLPLLLIVIMSWIVFWIDPKEMGTQISVSVTSMLTLIAYRFMVGTSLPRISYLTRMDWFILCSTLLVFTALLEVVVTGSLAKKGHVETARRIDRMARFLFPTAFVVVILGSLVV